jgi:hypothetical protein
MEINGKTTKRTRVGHGPLTSGGGDYADVALLSNTIGAALYNTFVCKRDNPCRTFTELKFESLADMGNWTIKVIRTVKFSNETMKLFRGSLGSLADFEEYDKLRARGRPKVAIDERNDSESVIGLPNWMKTSYGQLNPIEALGDYHVMSDEDREKLGGFDPFFENGRIAPGSLAGSKTFWTRRWDGREVIVLRDSFAHRQFNGIVARGRCNDYVNLFRSYVTADDGVVHLGIKTIHADRDNGYWIWYPPMSSWILTTWDSLDRLSSARVNSLVSLDVKRDRKGNIQYKKLVGKLSAGLGIAMFDPAFGIDVEFVGLENSAAAVCRDYPGGDEAIFRSLETYDEVLESECMGCRFPGCNGLECADRALSLAGDKRRIRATISVVREGVLGKRPRSPDCIVEAGPPGVPLALNQGEKEFVVPVVGDDMPCYSEEGSAQPEILEVFSGGSLQGLDDASADSDDQDVAESMDIHLGAGDSDDAEGDGFAPLPVLSDVDREKQRIDAVKRAISSYGPRVHRFGSPGPIAGGVLGVSSARAALNQHCDAVRARSFRRPAFSPRIDLGN